MCMPIYIITYSSFNLLIIMVYFRLASIQNKIGEALKEVDILVTTGSTNDRDLLKTILETYCKADIHFGMFLPY